MDFLKYAADRCTLCGICVRECPFAALEIQGNGVVIGDGCRMCGVCVRQCPEQALRFEQRARSFQKEEWRNYLVFAELERGAVHPVALELIGEARRMAKKLGYAVHALVIGGPGAETCGEELLNYGVEQVYVYEHPGFEHFRADCYADAFADCVAMMKPCSVLIGGTALGRSLAPRLSTRFHTGLTADCTALDIKPNSDMAQIRPAFGGDIMAQIAIARHGTGRRGDLQIRRHHALRDADEQNFPRGPEEPDHHRRAGGAAAGRTGRCGSGRAVLSPGPRPSSTPGTAAR